MYCTIGILSTYESVRRRIARFALASHHLITVGFNRLPVKSMHQSAPEDTIRFKKSGKGHEPFLYPPVSTSIILAALTHANTPWLRACHLWTYS